MRGPLLILLGALLTGCVVQTEAVEGNQCAPDSFVLCYTGPEGTRGVGRCTEGVKWCGADGKYVERCDGEVLPAPEDCTTSEDDDCDGNPLNAPGCVCAPGAVKACYTGPPETAGIGSCGEGLQVCSADGTSWTSCAGEVLPTAENCADPAFQDEDCNGFSCGKPQWWKSFGDSADQSDLRIAADPFGNVIMVGSFTGTLELCPTLSNPGAGTKLFVAKFDPLGNCLWAESFGDGSGDCGPRDVAVDDTGDVVVAGYFRTSVDFGCDSPLTSLDPAGLLDGFVAKLSGTDGVCMWAKGYGGDNDQDVRGVAANAGDVVVVGSFKGEMSVGCGEMVAAGGGDVYVAKLAGSDGDCAWSNHYGDAAVHLGNSVEIDSAGNVVLIGSFAGALNFDSANPAKMLTSAGDYDVFVAKLDTLGKHLWSASFGSIGPEHGLGIVSDSSKHVIVTGQVESTIKLPMTDIGSSDAFVVKYDSSGAYLWGHWLGNGMSNFGVDVAVDPSDNVFLTGSCEGTLEVGGEALKCALGGYDAFVVKFDPFGAHLWSKRFGDEEHQFGSGIATDPSGDVVLGGSFRGTIDFGLASMPSAGGDDVFLARFSR